MKSLERFVKAQQEDYEIALKEIKNGKKVSHWIWYIFPQLEGLGNSAMSEFYGIQNKEEAISYLKHPILGKRLIQISVALLELEQDNITEIMGYPDDLKLCSSMTLFALIDPNTKVFGDVLDKYYQGNYDLKTVKRLKDEWLNLNKEMREI